MTLYTWLVRNMVFVDLDETLLKCSSTRLSFISVIKRPQSTLSLIKKLARLNRSQISRYSIKAALFEHSGDVDYRPYYRREIYCLLLEFKRLGWEIVLATASNYTTATEVVRQYPIIFDGIIASNQYRFAKGSEKADLIGEFMSLNSVGESIFIGDSVSDLDSMRIVGCAIVVKRRSVYLLSLLQNGRERVDYLYAR